MTLIMRDSTNAPAIPTDTPVVAGYGDGLFQWSSADWARFPSSVKLSIVTNSVNQGDILDVETGDATPSDVPDWCDRFQRSGRRAPTVYVNRSNWNAVIQAVGSRRVDYWVSTLDGTRDVPGAVAVQYCGASTSNDPCKTAGNYDESVILDGGWIETMTPEQAQQLQDLHDWISGSSRTVNPGSWTELTDRVAQLWTNIEKDSVSKYGQNTADLVGEIQAAVNKLSSVTGVDPNALAAAVLSEIKAQWNK